MVANSAANSAESFGSLLPRLLTVPPPRATQTTYRVYITEAILPPEGKTHADRYNSDTAFATERDQCGQFVSPREVSVPSP